MAAIFLSYVRDDEARAAKLAELLEAAGHKVWWDRRIKGGAQYSAVIEEALKSADKVVVLWSSKSVESAWVRDEAAEGRDSGRLVPVVLDRSAPPLGFRQFQAVDFSGWRGTGEPPAMDELHEAIGGGAEARPRKAVRRPRPISLHPKLLVALVIALALAIGAYFLLLEPGDAAATVLVKAADSQPSSEASARDLSAKLAILDPVNTAGFRLLADTKNQRAATLVLAVAGKDARDLATRDVSLVSKDQSILWAAHYEQPRQRSRDLSAQVGAASALALTCAIEATGTPRRLPAATIRTYIAGCSEMENQTSDTVSNVAPLFLKVLTQFPDFSPAWDKLLKAEALRVMFEPHSDFSAPLAKHLEQARRHGADAAGAYLARAALRPANDFSGRIGDVQRGLAKYPDDARLHGALATLLTLVGRQSEAVEEALRASELLPLSPAARADYIFILAHSGLYPKAIEELRQAERLWPGTTTLTWTRFSLEMRYGDPRVALKLASESVARSGDPEAFLQARIAPTKANVERAIAERVAGNRQTPFFIAPLVQTLATFGRSQEALNILLDTKYPEYAGYQSEPFFRPALHEVRRDPRFMKAMAQMGLAKYWKDSGKWPDFCFEADLPYDCRKEADRYL